MANSFVIASIGVIVLIITDNTVYGRPQGINNSARISSDRFQPIAAETEKPLVLRPVPTQEMGSAPELGYKESSFSVQSKAGAQMKQVDGTYTTIGESQPIISRNVSSSRHECTITKYDPNRFPPYYQADCTKDDLDEIRNGRSSHFGSANNKLDSERFGSRPPPPSDYIENDRFRAGPASAGFAGRSYRPPSPPFNFNSNADSWPQNEGQYNQAAHAEAFRRHQENVAAARDFQNHGPRLLPSPGQYPYAGAANPGFAGSGFSTTNPRFSSSVNPGFYSASSGFSSINPGFSSSNSGFLSPLSSLQYRNQAEQHFSNQRNIPNFGGPVDLEFEYQRESGGSPFSYNNF